MLRSARDAQEIFPEDLPSMLDELCEEERKSCKLLEENTQAKPHLLPKAGQSGTEGRWNGPRGKSRGVNLRSEGEFL